MKRTMWTIAAVLVIALFLANDRVLGMPGFGLWPSEDWALAMMAVDAVAATVILFHPAGKAQALIGLTFLLQIGVHTGRVLNGEHADLNLYWWGLSLLAFLQIFVIGGWWLHEQLSQRRLVHADGALAHSANYRSLER